MLVALLATVSVSFPVHANSLPLITSFDADPPIELRNTASFTARTPNGQPYDSIKIKVVGDLGVSTQSTQFNTSFAELSWDTLGVDDGNYTIIFSAQDGGRATPSHEYEYAVSVKNDTPMVVLNESTSNRTISGFVSRPDASLGFKVGGKDVTMAPVITSIVNDAALYAWNAPLPPSIEAGTYTVEVSAAIPGGSTSVAIRTLLIPNSETGSGATPILLEKTPPLHFASEIGEFIAPVLPAGSGVDLYGVSVTDLTQKTSAQSGDGTRALMAQSSSARDDRSQSGAGDVIQPIQATENGWKIFSLEWYIWLMSLICLGAVTVIARRHVARRQASQLQDAYASV